MCIEAVSKDLMSVIIWTLSQCISARQLTWVIHLARHDDPGKETKLVLVVTWTYIHAENISDQLIRPEKQTYTAQKSTLIHAK